MPMSLELDHLAVAGATLDEATAHIETALGVVLEAGGVHVEMGTHNRLLSFGPGVYLEAIAVDPDGAAPKRPRWFDLDRFAGAPRLANWIARSTDLEATLDAAPEGMGVPIPFQRGRYAWSMAVPGTGRLPFDGAAPAMIQWDSAAHPADSLPDRGCRLVRLEIAHPDARELERAFPALKHLSLVEILAGPVPELRAIVDTPSGKRVLE